MTWKTKAVRCTTSPLHLCNRGVDGMAIFRTAADYARWNEMMFAAISKYAIELLFYVLMPNHYHICAKQQQAYDVSFFLQDVCWRYAKAFNRKYKREGHLFARRFRPVIATDDVGLLRLSYYVHFNPVSAGLAAEPGLWPYGSCQEYLGLRTERTVNLDPVLSLVGGMEKYQKFLREYNPNDPCSIRSFLQKGPG
jgi:putative transposase